MHPALRCSAVLICLLLATGAAGFAEENRNVLPLMAGPQSSISEVPLVVGLLAVSLLALMLYLTRTARRVAKKAVADNRELKQQIAELKRAGETLSRLAAIVESSDDAIIGTTLEGIITSWNAGAERIYGYAAQAVTGRSISILVPPDRSDEVPEILGRIQRGESVDHYETVRVRKDGERLYISLTASPIKDAAGSITGAAVIARDVTEHQQAELALRQANEKLARGLGELEQRTREITLLNELSDLLQTCLTAEEAYAIIGPSARQLFPDDAGGLYIINASRNWVEAVAVWGDLTAREIFTLDDCWALRRGQTQVLSTGRPGLLCPHLTGSPLPSASICIPMVAQGETLGMLHLQSRGDRAAPTRLVETTQQLAHVLADSLALALANLKLRETLRSQSIYDPLTGLFNRRYMEETLEREVHRGARNQRPLGIIMIDLDHFKRYNDTFGHAAGDALLRELGHCLKTRIRAGDVACRYGGEEFTILLPDTPMDAARQRAEMLREAANNLVPQYDGQVIGTVTLSLGVAVFPEHGSTADTVLRAADAALYRAKGAGRDQVATAKHYYRS